MRRRANAAELELFYAAAEHPLWDFGDFLLWGNPAFAKLKWQTMNDVVIKRLPAPQRVVLAMNIVDGQINNGGIEQLFFNHVHDIDVIAECVAAFGWTEFSARFQVLYETALSDERRGRIEGFNKAFQQAVARNGDHIEAWSEFRKVYTEVSGDALNDWYYEQPTSQQFNQAMLKFVCAHERDLIVLTA